MKQLLRRFRCTQPFNLVATSTLKFVNNLAGTEPDYLMRVLPRLGRIRIRLPEENSKDFFLYGCGDEGYSSHAYWRGWDVIEPETLSVWYYLSKKANTILDIGAYIGHMSLVSAASNPKARICAFEPLPMAYERLKLHHSINTFSNLEIYNLAVSDTQGSLPFYFPSGQLSTSNSLSKSFMENSEKEGFAKNLISQNVDVVTIDRWAEKHGITDVDLVKIDTEGLEPQVLIGMKRILEQYRPDLVIECLPSTETGVRARQILEPLGYKGHRLLSRTNRQDRINRMLNRWAGRNDEHTHNTFFTARQYSVEEMLREADRVSEV